MVDDSFRNSFDFFSYHILYNYVALSSHGAKSFFHTVHLQSDIEVVQRKQLRSLRKKKTRGPVVQN